MKTPLEIILLCMDYIMAGQLVWKLLRKPSASQITVKLPVFCVFTTSIYKVPCKIFPFCSNDSLEKTIEFKNSELWNCYCSKSAVKNIKTRFRCYINDSSNLWCAAYNCKNTYYNLQFTYNLFTIYNLLQTTIY